MVLRAGLSFDCVINLLTIFYTSLFHTLQLLDLRLTMVSRKALKSRSTGIVKVSKDNGLAKEHLRARKHIEAWLFREMP